MIDAKLQFLDIVDFIHQSAIETIVLLHQHIYLLALLLRPRVFLSYLYDFFFQGIDLACCLL